MAWRQNELLKATVLDNSIQGKVTGWIKFVGLPQVVHLDLDGNMNDDIRGKKIFIQNNKPPLNGTMHGFDISQKGQVICFTNQGPNSAGGYYFSWCSDQNGVVTIELDQADIEVDEIEKGWSDCRTNDEQMLDAMNIL